MNIRAATADDAAAICAIWNPVIRDTIATFNSQEKSPDDVTAMLMQKADEGHPFLLAEDDALLGFATYTQFRGGIGYRHTAEHTIILAPAAQGRGVGRRLMAQIVAHAAKADFHSLIAGVCHENTAGIAFHDRLGFATVATVPEVGRKFDRWHDLVLMQKML